MDSPALDMTSVVVQQPVQAALAVKNEIAVNEQEVMFNVQDASRFLISSPYVEQEHLLDLDTLDAESRILSEALVEMDCLRDDYATASYLDSFNWTVVMNRVQELTRARNHKWKETAFYIVVFRSQISRRSAAVDLARLDKAAHAEANASGGFLKYWFGVASDDLRNLATCIWRSKEDASRGSVGPDHKKAVQAVRTLYSEWKIDQHRLVIRDGASSWEITRWDG